MSLHFPMKLWLASAAVIAMSSSCAVIDKMSSGMGTTPDYTTQSSSTNVSSAINATSPVAFLPEFDDIPVPAELRRDEDMSFVYETTGVSLGVVTYTGFYKPKGIAAFYRNEMPLNAWKFINAFTDSGRYYLSYVKDTRSCIITVEETTMSTKLVIKIGPTTSL
ncbi:MAG: hypothetical protein HQM07_01515 [Zetaproteobacteria bacterium]|nr:hypothetical protein [Zetaproteobacteria bacterium]